MMMTMTMRTFMGSSRIKLCRVQSVVAAKERCYSLSTLLSPSGSIVPLKGTREQLDKRLPLTKIVATIGPASEHLPALSHVVDAGMRIMRINFSHATYDEADLRMRNLSACAVIDHTADAGQVHMRAVMLDTQGPEIRTGSFSSGTKEVLLKEGDLVTLTTDESVRQQQTSSHIWISYRKLYDTVSLGSSILLDDGIVELKVESKGSNGTEVTCRVMNSGVVGNKKGVNMPGLPVELPAMSDKDKLDIRWGIQNNIDYIAASFVRKASDVTEIRDYCRELIRELYPEGDRSPPVPIPSIISKIESVEALINFESILQTSDAIMVARGDLAVEIPMETLANVQKEMVRRCNAAGKPVIVATQMLESMQKNPRPTRAECTDVANAVIDGADCVMLSGESAKGKYPVESVAIMNSIVHQAELGLLESEPSVARRTPAISDPLEAMAYSVVQAATSHRANPRFNCIVVMHSSSPSSTSTDLARLISKHRPHVPIVTIVPDYKSGRLLQVHKGIHPVLMLLDTDRVEVPQTLQYLRQLGIVRGSDQVLVVGQQSPGSAITVSLTSA